LPDDAGTIRIIAGEYDGRKGPARTYSPLNVWDLRLGEQKRLAFDVPAGWTAAIVVLHGTVLVNDSEIVREAQFALLDPAGSGVVLEANNDATILVLCGEPLDEPVVGHGPFVMNTRTEIIEAIQDFNSGRFGRMAH
jgi:redox-sensitive bicupin YhaK (pirin superfamily)